MVSLILGIVSCVLAFISFWFATLIFSGVAVICGIIGIIFGARNSDKPGLIVSVVGTSVAAILFLIMLIVLLGA